MTKFANKTFSSSASNQAYRDNWDRMFGEQPKDYRFPCDVCGKLIWKGWFAPGGFGLPNPVKCGACSDPPRDEAPNPTEM